MRNRGNRSLAPLVAALATFSVIPSTLFAHGGEHHLDLDTVAGWWTFDPLVIMALAVSGILYAVGLRRLWRRAGRDHGIRSRQAAAFAAGWLTLFMALVSPLHRLGEILFSAHMLQHELLMLVAAPLLVLGRPIIPFLWALPGEMRTSAGNLTKKRWFSSVWDFISAPLAVWLILAVALWVWHLPSLYQATLRSDAIHALQHSSFLGSALLFWWAVIHGRYGRMGYGMAVLYVFTTAVHSSILGALLTFAPRLVYPVYSATAAQWGLSALEDQQLAGLYMWVPSGLVFTGIGLALFASWMKESERRARYATRSSSVVPREGEA